MSTKTPNGLDKLGLKNIGKVYYNISYDELQAHEIDKNECKISSTGTAICDTGIFTGRSPKDKYFVDQEPSNKHIFWGKINKKIDKETFDKLFEISKDELSGKDLYIMDVYSGASEASKKSIRFISEVAWQAHFVKNMFIRPTEEELETFEPDFVVYNACKTTDTDYKEHGLNSDVFVCFDVERNISIIGGTWYGGEMKKGIFSMMNYWLPLEGKLSM
ncbi:MAG TPA: phosphoenolpyruvate carboxykinase (ATP), partial [Campylobacterales bacterium]|nr:phosphoenolpyruvate carboxykinase (ATP) [Campylobacterales bacterium]